MRNDRNYKNTNRSVSPTNSKRACLCWDQNTYHVDCCDGSRYAQGIGSINRTA